MKKYLAEFIGPFFLVFVGTGTVVIAGIGDATIGDLGIGLAFGMAVTIMACVVEGISGGNYSPAVSLGMMINRRLNIKGGIIYIISLF